MHVAGGASAGALLRIALSVMRALLTVTALAAAALALSGGPAGARQAAFITFQTPSKNIGCGLITGGGEPAFFRCDINSGLKPLPRRPLSCDVDWGIAVGMNRTGKARALCVGDTVRVPNARVLAYGTTWRRSGFTCVSKTTGLRCTNASRRGFFLSRERSRIF